MNNDIDINLNNDYSFEVLVSFTQNITHSGELLVSKGEISISFTCEYYEESEKEIFASKYELIKCKTHTSQFFLFDLEQISMASGILDYYPNARSFYKGTYSVGYFIQTNSDYFDPQKIIGFSLISNDIKKWIGNTEKQEQIIKDYHDNQPFNASNNTEYTVEVTENSILYCIYSLTAYHNSPDQKAGINFPPKTIYQYKTPVDNKVLIQDLKSLVSYFSFIIGYNIHINRIEVLFQQSFNLDKPNLYININYPPISDPFKIILFPLSKNLRFQVDNLPEFPLETFQSYFKLNKYYKNLFAQYLKQQTMPYSEDRFLTVFRIVETLAYVQKEYFPDEMNNKINEYIRNFLISNKYKNKEISGYLNQIKNINKSKYNTEVNIRRVYKRIEEKFPESIRSNKRMIPDMVKLRNDITHANEFSISELVLTGYISILSVFATYLLMNLVGISEKNIKNIMYRIKEMHRVEFISYNDNSSS